MKSHVLPILIAFGLAACQRPETGASTAEASGKAAAVQTPTVPTVRATTREVFGHRPGPGSFVSRFLRCRPNESGIIVATLVDVGDFGRKARSLPDGFPRRPLRADQARAAQQQSGSVGAPGAVQNRLGTEPGVRSEHGSRGLAARAAYESARRSKDWPSRLKRYEN